MDRHGEKTKRRLEGTVEVDEAFVGGAPKFRRGVKNKRGKGTPKPQILVAVQRDGEARTTLIPNARRATIEPLVDKWVDPSAVLMTDAARAYRKIGEKFAGHHTVNHSKKQFVDRATGAHVNTSEAFIGQVERALVGVYHLLPKQHLQRYLDEIAWRWNRRQRPDKVRGSGDRHRIWRPVPVLAQMTELLRNAPGRQIRRSENFGLHWPA